MSTLAPIVLFAYKRPQHTRAALDMLSRNELAAQSKLYIFIDGLKDSASETDRSLHRDVIALAESQRWAQETKIIKSNANKGLAASVVEGVSDILKQHGKAIVLEDDLVTSPFFLRFMNSALDKYEGNPDVACISGYVYPLSVTLDTACFIKGADCWGWATWQNQWERIFEHDPVKLYDELVAKQLTSAFDFNDSYPYMQMLKDRIAGKNQSWAILWYASAFLKNTYCLYPPKSLVHNIGNDGSGTHNSDTTHQFDVKLLEAHMPLLPDEVKESKEARKAFELFFLQVKATQEAENQNRQKSSLLKRLASRGYIAIQWRLQNLFKKKEAPVEPHGWFGNYESWEAAEAQCSGYDAGDILQTVRASILKVKSGKAIYERDSVLFNEVQHSLPLIAAFTDSIENKRLHVTDFGGSLGSSYFQHRNVFAPDVELKWAVVEQAHFVECGKKEIAGDRLSFYKTIDEALEQQDRQVLFLSSVLPYIKEPYELIASMLQYRFKYIIVDRTAFIDGDAERITKQIVPSFIYKASYPAWFFNEQKFIKAFTAQYELLHSFDSVFDPVQNLEDGVRAYRKGFYFKLRENAAL